MVKVNTESLVKKLLVGSTALCSAFLLASQGFADTAKPYEMTEVESPSATSVEIDGKYYEFKLLPGNIDREDGRTKYTTYEDPDPATTCTAANNCIKVTLPNGKDQYLKYTYTGTYAEETARKENPSSDVLGLKFNNCHGAKYGSGTSEDPYYYAGGAIYNTSAPATAININSDFVGNSTDISDDYKVYGGAIFNGENAKIGNITGSFVGNYIKNTSSSNDNGVFGGAIYNKGTMVAITGDFVGNWAYSQMGDGGVGGGAIFNDDADDTEISSIDANFVGNYVESPYRSVRGGAIYNAKKIGNINGNFVGNYATSGGLQVMGGAIYNSYYTEEFIEGAEIDSISANFIGNYAKADSGSASGGAIYNRGSITSLSGDFIGNYAFSSSGWAMGGAIYNNVGPIDGLSGKFIGNYAESDSGSAFGGAVYNDGGEITVKSGDTVTFAANYTRTTADGKVLNDIYNSGYNLFGEHDAIINLYGTMNLDGGIDGASDAQYNQFNVYDGADLGFRVKAFAANPTAIDLAAGTTIQHQTVTFEADKTVTFTPLVAVGAGFVEGSVDQYKLFDQAVTADGVTFKFVNSVYDITFDKATGVFKFKLKDVPPGPGPEPERDPIRQNILAAGGSENDVKLAEFLVDTKKQRLADNQLFNDVQQAIFDEYQLYHYTDVVKATKAMNPDEAPAVSEAAIDMVQNAFGLAGARLTSGITLADGARGKASGSAARREGAWAKGFYGKSKLKGGSGFKNESKGIGLGFDHAFTPYLMAGVGYAYGQSDIDTDSRNIKVKTHTPIIYAEYKKNKWFLDGMVSYSFGKYDEKKSVVGINNDVGYDVNTLGAQIVAGYAVAPWFVPELGFRYFNVSQKDYTDKLGDRFDRKNANIFTGVLGAKFAKEFKPYYDVKLIPEVRVAASYDFVRDNNEVDVTLANMHSYTFKGEKLERLGFEADAGLRMDVGLFELSARYQGRFRSHYTNHTGLLEARYEF